ncbi:MAG TPA: hypothetical protein DC024_04200 [Clostridiales bacterium]|nr:hypothetical protein [Clostridiales bacterium]
MAVLIVITIIVIALAVGIYCYLRGYRSGLADGTTEGWYWGYGDAKEDLLNGYIADTDTGVFHSVLDINKGGASDDK